MKEVELFSIHIFNVTHKNKNTNPLKTQDIINWACISVKRKDGLDLLLLTKTLSKNRN